MAVEHIGFSSTDRVGDDVLIGAVRAGDAQAYEALVRRHHQSLLKIAGLYVEDSAAAAHLVLDTWRAALANLDQFDGRSSARTWLYRVLVGRARPRSPFDAIPFASTTPLIDDPYPGAIDQHRLRQSSDRRWPLHWAVPPVPWPTDPDHLSGGVQNTLVAAIEALSPAQKEVLTLRDILGWGSGETASALGISETNQRVLLRRARNQVRNQLEEHLIT